MEAIYCQDVLGLQQPLSRLPQEKENCCVVLMDDERHVENEGYRG